MAEEWDKSVSDPAKREALLMAIFGEPRATDTKEQAAARPAKAERARAAAQKPGIDIRQLMQMLMNPEQNNNPAFGARPLPEVMHGANQAARPSDKDSSKVLSRY